MSRTLLGELADTIIQARRNGVEWRGVEWSGVEEEDEMGGLREMEGRKNANEKGMENTTGVPGGDSSENR